MASLQVIIDAWAIAHWEFSEALRDLADENVWKRPHPALLSVGELAGHIIYWEAVRFLGPGPLDSPDLEKLPIKSPLIDNRFRYYTTSVQEPVDLGFTSAELWAEFDRVHQAAKAVVTQEGRDSEDPIQGHDHETWGGSLKYQVFHVAYHTGQAYSVRHLLGETTPDN